MVLYIYAVISFAFLHESANSEGNALYCDSLGQCFISVIRWGLIDNLGLVGPLFMYIIMYTFMAAVVPPLFPKLRKFGGWWHCMSGTVLVLSDCGVCAVYIAQVGCKHM